MRIFQKAVLTAALALTVSTGANAQTMKSDQCFVAAHFQQVLTQIFAWEPAKAQKSMRAWVQSVDACRRSAKAPAPVHSESN